MKKVGYIIALFSVFSLPFSIFNPLRAQGGVNMSNGDTIFLDACTLGGGTIYDDGGPSGNYSNNFNGWIVITSTPGATITLSGAYNTESSSYDWINVWDGSTLVVNRGGGSGSLNVTATTGSLTLQFHTDGSVNYSGFSFTWTSSAAGTMNDCNDSVANLAITSLTDNLVSLSWEASPSTDTFTVYTNGVCDTVVGTTCTLSGLSPNMRYDFHVMALADDSNFCCAAKLSTRTLCGLSTFPYFEGFEDIAVGDVPDCWLWQVNFDDADYKPQVDGAHSASGYHSMMLSCGSNNTGEHFGMVATPPFAGTATRRMTLNLRSSHTGTPLVLGLCDSTGTEYNNYGFTPFDTLWLNSGWSTRYIDWTPAQPSQRLAFYMLQSMQSGTGRRIYIDNLNIETCAVDSLAVSHTDYDRTTLSWTVFNNPVCTVTIRAYGAAEDTLVIDTAVSPLVITGLEADRTYTLTVHPQCGSVSGVPRSITVTTAPMPVDAASYCSPFHQGGSVPQGWTLYPYGNNLYKSGIHLYWYGYGADTSRLVTERMMNLGGRRLLLRYRASGAMQLKFGTVDYADDLSTLTPLGTVTPNADNRDHTLFFDLPDSLAATHLSIGFSGSGTFRLYALEIGDSALLMGDQRWVDRRGSEVVLEWDTVRDTVLVEYGISGFEPGSGTIDTFYSCRYDTVQGLDSSAIYDFYVYLPSWHPCRDRVLTAGLVTDASSYCSPLRQNSGLPSGWTTHSNSNYLYKSGNSIYWYGYGYGYGTSYLVTEQFGNLGGKRMLLQYQASSSSEVSLGTMEYPDDPSTFTLLETQTLVSDYNFYHTLVFDLPDSLAAAHLSFGFSGSGYVYLDAIEIGDSASLMGDQRWIHRRGSSIQLEWDTIRDTVLVEYGPSGFVPGSGTIDTFYNSNRGNVRGLTFSTTYDFYIYQPSWHPCPDRVFTVTTATDDYPMPFCEDFWVPASEWSFGNNVSNTPRFANQPYNSRLGRDLELASWGPGYSSSVILPDVEIDSGAWLSFYVSDNAPQSILQWDIVRANQTSYHDYLDTVHVSASDGRRHYVMPLPSSPELFDGRLYLKYYHNYDYLFYRCFIDELQVAHSAYGTLTPIYVGYDSASFTLSALYGTDSAEVTLISAVDTHTVLIDSTDIVSFSVTGLAPGRIYDVYVRPFGGGCPSYALAIVTRYDFQGGGGTGTGGGYVDMDMVDCFAMEDVLSYELPRYWAAEGTHDVTLDNALRFDAHTALALHPSQSLAGRTLTFRARSTAVVDTLVLGLFPADSIPIDSVHFVFDETFFSGIDTFTTDTAFRSFALKLQGIPSGNWRLCFKAGNGDALLGHIGIISCPMVNFEVSGNAIVCTQDSPSQPYYIAIDAADGSDHRVIRVDENPFTILVPKLSTSYTLSWYCDEYQACIPSVTLNTQGAVPLPYCEYFTTTYGDIQLPSTWTLVKGAVGDTVMAVKSSYYDPPRLSLQPNGTSHWMYVVLPVFQTDSALSLFLQAHVPGYIYSDCLQIGVLDSGTDTSSFIPLYSNPYLYQNIAAQVEMSLYANKRVAIRCRTVVDLENIRVYGLPIPHYSLPHAGQLKVTSVVAKPYCLETSTASTYAVTSSPQTLVLGTGSHSVRPLATPGGTTCEGFTTLNLRDSITVPYCSGGQYLYSDSWYILNELNVPSLDGITVGVDYECYGSGTLVVGMLTDAMDVETFTPVDTLTGAGTTYVDLSSYADTGRWVTFRNPAGGSSVYIGQVKIETCAGALSATASLVRWNQVRIDAHATPFYAEYFDRTQSSPGAAGNTVVRIDSVPTFLTVDPDTKLRFQFHCDSLSLACRPAVDINSLSGPFEVPICIDFDTVATGTILRDWNRRSGSIAISNTRSHSGNQSLAMPISSNAYAITPDVAIDSVQRLTMSLWYYTEDASDRLVVGVMSNPDDLNTFHPIRAFASDTPGTWQRGLLEFSSAPDEAFFLAFQARSNRQPEGRTVYVDDIYIDTNIAFDLRVKEITSTSITLDWTRRGSSDVTVTVKDGNTVARTYTQAIPPLFIDSLATLHYYTFLFTSDTGGADNYCNTNGTDSLSVVTPAPGVGCINAADLHSPQAVFYSGRYDNPYALAGPINYGLQNPDTRHTVCYDTAARDPRTGNQLRTIPEGYTSSVRLGNWSTNYFQPEAEGVIYSLYVDTSSFELLLLRYAAVLQDPLHATVDQPRFRMELLDTNFNLIDSACTSADFVANQSLGWHTAPDGVLWKDWTAVGVDLTDYAGQQVYFRLTTYDCNEGSHYGYAYFTVECMRKSMTTMACGDVDSNTFAAPEGFNYRWYTNLSTATVGTAQRVTLPRQDVTYYCDVSKLDNANCYYTINTYGGTRYPMSSFDTASYIENCHFHVQFTNNSAISNDGVSPIGGTQCETAYWDFGNGHTSTHYDGDSTVYLFPGTYTVTLISGIAEDACQDTSTWTLVLSFPDELLPADTTHASICDNQSYPFYSAVFDTAGTYRRYIPNSGGCDSLHVLYLTVRNTSGSDTTATVCDSLSWRTVLFTADTDYTTPPVELNAQGCDSTVTLHLTVHYSDSAVLTDTVVQNELPYHAADTSLVLTDFSSVHPDVANGQWQLYTHTVHGCDSILNLQLAVWLNRDTVIDTSICRNRLPLAYEDSLFSPVEGYSSHLIPLVSSHGTDSLVTLNITVFENPTASYADTVVENDLPRHFRGIHYTAPIDTVLLLLSDGTGCDTFANYSLHVWYNRDTTLYNSICSDALPYQWEGHTFNADDPYATQGLLRIYRCDVLIPTTHGADSVLHLELEVRPIYDVYDSIIICPGYPHLYLGVDYGGPTEFDALFQTRLGCDSLVHVVIMDRDSSYRLHPWYRFDSADWQMPDSVLRSCDPTLLELVDSTDGAVAWQWACFMKDTMLSSLEPTFSVAVDTGRDAMTGYVSLIATDTIGCFDTVGWPLFVFLSSVPDFQWQPDVPAIHNPEVQFENLTWPDTVGYLWNIQSGEGGGFDTSTAVNPFYHWGDGGENSTGGVGVPGDYTVRLVATWPHTVDSFRVDTVAWIDSALRTTMLYETFTHACVDSVEHIVTITNDFLQFPNLVSPNGDGVNDIWEVVNLLEFGHYSMNELWIYDRTGALVYYVKNIRRVDQFWDPNATRSPDGTYYYRFSAKGEYGLVKRNGLIEVLR